MPTGVAEELRRRLASDLESALGPTDLELYIEQAWSYPAAPPGWASPDHEICMRVDHEHAVRYGVVDSEPIEPQLARIADNMQDDVIKGLMRVWPPCPGHPHQADAELQSGEAVWICPQDGRVIAAIGALAPK